MAEAEHRDALPGGKVRGRGAGLNPGNRFEPVRLHVRGEHLDDAAAERPDGVQVATVVMDDATRSLINPITSPDLPLKWTINPYRGCEHGCIYCYARPGHEYLGLSCGLDFETRLFAKRNAPELLRRELSRPSWKGEAIDMCGVTDAYQPIERELRITRGCLEVMALCNQPVSIITKSALVTRDIDLLGALARKRAARVAISLTTLDPGLASKMEPRAASPRARLEAIRELASAGIPVAVMTAPIIPGLNDREIPALLREAEKAGASNAGFILLRLPHQVRDLFIEWLHRRLPDRAGRVERLIRETRGGELNDDAFFSRHRGRGPMAEQIGRAFKVFAKRAGFAEPWPALSSALFRKPIPDDGPTLFDAPTLFDHS